MNHSTTAVRKGRDGLQHRLLPTILEMLGLKLKLGLLLEGQ